MKYILFGLITFVIWFCGVTVGVGVERHFTPVGPRGPIQTSTIKEDCPNWICTTRSDGRDLETFTAECAPRAAVEDRTGAVQFWCSQLINPIDGTAQLPAGWSWE